MTNNSRSVQGDYPMTYENNIVWTGICIDCNKEWSMTSTEKRWWEKRISEGDFVTLPKRCKPCRDKRKNEPPHKKISNFWDVARRLEAMSIDAINDQYEDRGDFLAQELSDLAKILEKIGQK